MPADWRLRRGGYYDNSHKTVRVRGGGIFREFSSPPDHAPGWIVPTRLTFFQNSVWSDNVYNGPSAFYAWN
jgi:hypothetical protein